MTQYVQRSGNICFQKAKSNVMSRFVLTEPNLRKMFNSHVLSVSEKKIVLTRVAPMTTGHVV